MTHTDSPSTPDNAATHLTMGAVMPATTPATTPATPGPLEVEGVGVVYVKLLARSRRITMRRKEGCLHVTAPAGIAREQLIESVSRMARRLPPPTLPPLSPGAELELRFGRLTLCRGEENYNFSFWRDYDFLGIPPRKDKADVLLRVGRCYDFTSPAHLAMISDMAARAVQSHQGPLLLDHAACLAVRLGISPAGWRIGHGKRILGSCSSLGVVTLSRYILFLPAHLMDFIICHELGHLLHFDHSSAFHTAVNALTGGNEERLHHELKTFKWPILR